jgi:hypothetical protein
VHETVRRQSATYTRPGRARELVFNALRLQSADQVHHLLSATVQMLTRLNVKDFQAV